MKKSVFVLAFVLVFGGFATVTHADGMCGDINLNHPGSSVVDPVTSVETDTPAVNFVACDNGPIMPQQPGGRYLKAGEEDCPAWFSNMFGHACYTMRPLGVLQE